MVRSGKKRAFASGFLCPSRLQLLAMVDTWFGRLAVTFAERRSRTRRQAVVGPNSGIRAEIGGANGPETERHRRSRSRASIAHDNIAGITFQRSLLVESFERRGTLIRSNNRGIPFIRMEGKASGLPPRKASAPTLSNEGLGSSARRVFEWRKTGGFRKERRGIAEKRGGKMRASTSCPDGNCK